MAHIIISVEPGSIADQLEIRTGDKLLSINGQRVLDFIDYQALCSFEKIELEVERDAECMIFDFEKDEFEDLGLNFATPLMSEMRDCCNKCVFCFVDQLPKGTRESMHVKDDDWRTSLMMGSFVTLTNVTEKELQRIIERQATPLYISVHATDDALRAKLLGTERGRGIMKRLKKLSDGGISFHAQAVLCPGLNDGEALEQTIEDLVSLYPACQSLALVPVGLTAHRNGLEKLAPYDSHSANDALDRANRWQNKLLRTIGTRFVYPADELYILASQKFPNDEAYEGYPQIDNGVGLCRLLDTEFHEAYEQAKTAGYLKKAHSEKIAIACGVSVAPFLAKLLSEHPIENLKVVVHPVQNRFFGESVTVSGLLTGQDLIANLKGLEADRLLISCYMLRDGEHVFLDGTAPKQVEQELGMPILAVDRTGEALLLALMGE